MADYLTDGQDNFLGGQDASKVPSLISRSAVASAVNASFSRGVPGPRWGSSKRRITIPAGGVTNSSGGTISYEEIFYGGRFQCQIPYQIGTENFLIIVVSGVIYLVSIQTFTAQILTVSGGGLNETTPRLNWSTAGKYFVIFDFPNYPVILDGNIARRASPADKEVPISVLGTYNQNRLAIGNAGNDFTLGDPAGSLATPDAPITFEEIIDIGSPYFLQNFQLPTGVADGPITAMGFLQNVDTSTGIGPMLVATANSVFTFQTQQPRSQWENGQFGASFVATSGIVGPRAFINVNSDLFFLSSDYQLRAASMSRQEQGKWSKVPISREVDNWLYTNDPSLSHFAVLGYFQNKVLVATNPYRVVAHNTDRQSITDVAHGGMVVLELDNQATLGKDSPPVWAGLWTPFRVMDICTTNLGQRCFAMAKDEGRNELYEFLPEQTFDEDNGYIRQIVTILDTPEFDFKSTYDNKAFHSIDTEFKELEGFFKADVYFKPAQGTEFAKWQSIQNTAPWRTCKVPEGCFVNGFATHEIRDQTLGYPVQNKVCDQTGKTTYNIGKRVQLKFVVTAINWILESFRIKCTAVPQSQQISTCTPLSDDAICASCLGPNPWAIPPFRGCSDMAVTNPCAPIDTGARYCGECD